MGCALGIPVVGIGEALRLAVVAEGVETEEQLAEMRRLRCRFVQGYFTGGPRPAADIRACVKQAGEATVG